MAHMESFRANTVNARSVYVAISRAKEVAALYTDDRAKLTEALGLRDGAQVGAIDEPRRREVEMAMAIVIPERNFVHISDTDQSQKGKKLIHDGLRL